MIAILTLVLSIAPITPPAGPRGFLTAGQLEQYCSAPADDREDLMPLCLGYLAGSWDQLLASAAQGKRPTLCAPSDLSLDATRLKFLQFMAENPGLRAVGAASTIESTAWASSFSCPAPWGF
jgi:hypothetical protein